MQTNAPGCSGVLLRPWKHARLGCSALGAVGGTSAARGEIGTVPTAHKCEQAIPRQSKHTSLVPTLGRPRLQRRTARGVDLVEMWYLPGTHPHIWRYGCTRRTSRNREGRSPDHVDRLGSCNTLRLRRASGWAGSGCAHTRCGGPERVNSHTVKMTTVECPLTPIWPRRPAHTRGLLSHMV